MDWGGGLGWGGSGQVVKYIDELKKDINFTIKKRKKERIPECLCFKGYVKHSRNKRLLNVLVGWKVV